MSDEKKEPVFNAANMSRALNQLYNGVVVCHGRFSTDWVGSDIPLGGAEEIAALRKELDELQQKYLKLKYSADTKRDEARLCIRMPLPDDRSFNSACVLQDNFADQPPHVQALYYEEWLRTVARNFADWIRKGE